MSDDLAHATPRRNFLKSVSAAAAATGLAAAGGMAADDSPATGTKTLPTMKLGEHTISRMLAGWNQIGGFSHATPHLSRYMQEWFTVDRSVEFLTRCESEGITGWQFDHWEKGVDIIRRLREQGTKMKFICLHAERSQDAPPKKVVDDTGCIAIVHHGGVTDSLFRAGRAHKVRDFVKRVHDSGAMAGVSTHNTDNMKRIVDEGWENDLFMCSFYNLTKSAEEQIAEVGKATIGEPFFEGDPDKMTALMRQIDKPCLAFKILAAARKCWSKHAVEKCFQYAYLNIKPTDGVIVGMFPVYSDEVAEDTGYCRKYAASGA